MLALPAAIKFNQCLYLFTNFAFRWIGKLLCATQIFATFSGSFLFISLLGVDNQILKFRLGAVTLPPTRTHSCFAYSPSACSPSPLHRVSFKCDCNVNFKRLCQQRNFVADFCVIMRPTPLFRQNLFNFFFAWVFASTPLHYYTGYVEQ